MSTYKKIPDKISNKGNADEKKIIENKEVVNRMFITLKDHKTNFLNISVFSNYTQSKTNSTESGIHIR